MGSVGGKLGNELDEVEKHAPEQAKNSTPRRATCTRLPRVSGAIGRTTGTSKSTSTSTRDKALQEWMAERPRNGLDRRSLLSPKDGVVEIAGIASGSGSGAHRNRNQKNAQLKFKRQRVHHAHAATRSPHAVAFDFSFGSDAAQAKNSSELVAKKYNVESWAKYPSKVFKSREAVSKRLSKVKYGLKTKKKKKGVMHF